MDSRIRTGYVPVTIALVMLLLFVTPVMADDWVGGIPLETIKSGVVSGGLYHDAVFGFNYTGPNGTITDDGNTVEKVFTLPSHTEVKWARLYVAAYCGSMKGNYQVNLEVNFDGAGDGAYDKTWNEHLNSEYGYPGEGGDGPVYLDNGTRVTSDYLYWYDVTDVIDSTSVKTLVKTSKPDGYTGTFDGRIKLVALVIAYEDGSTDQVHYWVNQGHDVSSYYDEDYKGRISFDTSKLSGVDPESADLTIFHMASKNGDLWIGGEPVTGTEPQGSYSGSYQWDVLDQMPGSSIDFEYRFNTDKDVNFFKIPLAFLTIKQAERDLPDLTIAGPVNPIPPTAIFARESNPVRIINVKNNGPGAATNIPVALYASDVSTTDPVNTTTIDALASGEQTNVIIVDPTIRDHEGGKVIYTAVVDPENTIDEVDKTNNKKSSVEKPVRYNGYKGKGIYWEGGSNITTKRTYDLQGDIVYASQPESAYKSIGWTDRTEIWTGTDLSIPAGATIEDAWLYIVYNWDQTAEGVPSVTVTFNDKPLILDTPYTDKSNFGGYPNHKYGLYPAVDVTDHFVRDGDNTLIMTANAENKNALYPSTLAVVYRDPSATRKQIFINEECDVLAYSESTYGTSLEEATAYVPFSDMEIETTGVQKATLHSFAGSAGPDEGNLFFNGDTVETSAWQGTANTCEALVANVTAYITATGNEAAVQSTDSGGMCTYHQFLVIEYSDETGLPDLTVSTLASNSGEVFSASNNTYTAMITNIGTGDAGAFDVGFNASNVTGTVPVAGLAAGADITITWTDETIHSAGDVVTITVTTDPKDSIREADEENNHKSITKTVVHNGYRGMRWTDGEDITTAVIYTVRGDLVYSSGNSTYLSASTYPNWTDYVVTWTAGDLAVPAGATIAGARLYVPYTWDKGPVFPEDVTLTFNSETVDRSAFYEDEKMWGSSYPYGMTVYDVTDIFSPEGNTALLTNTFPGGGNVSIRGMLLAVVYDDGTTAPHTVLMNEGFDLLYGGAAQSTTPEQATAYAPFNLNAKDALSARLVTVAPGAGPTKGDLIFNDRVWTRVWNYTGTTQIGVDDRDVTTLLGDENLAGFRSDADYMEAAAAFLVVEYSDETGLPDLSVSAIKPNAGAGDNIFANELNTISVTVENQGTGSAGASILLVDVGGTEYTRPVGTLAPGANETVTITHNVLYAHGAVVNVTATADSGSMVDESNETNNVLSANLTVYDNGYKGKRWTHTLGGDMETQATFSGRYDLVYSHGNSSYKGAKWSEQTVIWSAENLTIPEGATVVDARLYQAWGWNKMTGDPAPTVTFNDVEAGAPVASYKDRKNWGSYDYPYGLYFYNVTDQFNAAGNTMTLTPEADNDYFTYGAYLVVVYEDPKTTRKQILINEEFDMVCSRASYSVNNDEATVYAPFSGIDAASITGARAIAILASADDEGKSKFFFNDQEYTGFWEDYKKDPQIGFSVYDVTDTLQDGMNEARLQSFDTGSGGDSMYAMTTILVTEYADSTLPDLIISAIKPNTGAGDNIFANELNTISVTVENQGTGPAGASTLLVDIGGTEYTRPVGTLAPGANETVTITHNVLYAHGAVVNVTATADSGSVVDESNETNNVLSANLTVYDNGYKGKRWTHTLGGDMETEATFSGRYDIVYSHGDSVYRGAKWQEQTVIWSADDLKIPEGATVASARLYQAWGWNKMAGDPAPNVTFNGIAVGAPVASYKDRKNWGSYDYPYGLYVYDVTEQFDAAGNTMTLTPEADNDYLLYGGYLVVVYEDPATTEKQILINEEFDMVCSRASYSVNNDEATVYAPFSGIDTAGITGARAIAILASANDEGKSKFFFNDREYAGFWEDYQSTPQIGFSVYDVTDALQDGANEARLQSFDTGSGGDSMYAMTTILVTEYAAMPVADFTGAPTTGTAPLEVRFTDTSTGRPVQWMWEFGDGRIATTKNPIITYRQPGTYTVNLTVTYDDGSSSRSTKANYITVTQPDPVASFTADHTSGNADLTVQFTDTSTGSPTSWNWDFGDGSSSTGQNPAHTYTTAGTYTATLTVRRGDGPASTAERQITVRPVADFTADRTRGNAGLTVQFTDKSTGSPTSWAWDFGDGATSTGQNPAHIYSTPGTYTVRLTVTGGGQTHTEAKTAYITVVDPGAPPVAEFRADTTGGYAPLSVRFFDQSQGNVTAWLWNFGDGTTSTGQNPTHTYTTAGTYAVTLTVTGDAGSNTITKTAYITVDDPKPVADFVATRLRGEAPLTVQFTDNSTGAPSLTRAWDFGDGTTSALQNPTHIFDHDGEGARTYTVTLTVTNSAGSDVKKTEIIVVAPPQKEDVADRVDKTSAITIENIPVTYQDLALEIPKGNEAKQADNAPITELSVGVAPDLKEPAVGTIEIGGKAFKLGPEGAKFYPAIPVTITFTEDEWKKLFGDGRTTKIQRYDGTNWVELENQTRDDVRFTITGYTNSFSVFAPVTTTTTPPSRPTAAPPSSSGGGGGPQASVGAASNLKAGDRAALSMSQTAISSVTFTAKNQIRDVMVTMAKGSLPRDAKPPAGTVYQYIEATLYRAAVDDFSSIQFRFSVPASWIKEQGSTKDEIRLFRLADNDWQEVPVEVLGEESGNVIFTADPEGFSLFAITTTGKAPDVTEPTPKPTESVTTPPADVTRPPAGTTPTTPKPTPLPVWVAVTALGASLLLVRRRA